MNDMLVWFGLKRHPFDKEIKTSDLFGSDALAECAARLDYIKQRRGTMLLTGDPGVGKTVALRRFVDSLNENLYRPVYTPLATLNRFDILRHINQKLGLAHRGSKSSLYTQIQRELLESKEQRGKTVVLIIDEAQLLQTGPLHELRLMTNFRMDSYEPFILILAGQSDLRRVMEFAVMEPLSQRLRMRYHMGSLAPEQTTTYIEHQLKLAGASEPILTPDALAATHEQSFGIPRRINNIANQALLLAMCENKRTIDADMVLKVKTGG
jgi:type II secretory pathway predicted ATPase ExeA